MRRYVGGMVLDVGRRVVMIVRVCVGVVEV